MNLGTSKILIRAEMVNSKRTHCDFLNRLFSTPVWFPLIRATAVTRSSGVKNHAVVGLSGK